MLVRQQCEKLGTCLLSVHCPTAFNQQIATRPNEPLWQNSFMASIPALTPPSSVTRWLDYLSIFGHLQQCHKFAQVGSVFCKIRNKLSKICQRLVNTFDKVAKFAKSGHTASLPLTHNIHLSVSHSTIRTTEQVKRRVGQTSTSAVNLSLPHVT